MIFCGRFGNGKTEIAINYALSLAKRSTQPPILLDLDIVTPYFRTREMALTMKEQGVEVIAPAVVSQYLDTPGIRPEILGAIQQDRRPVVLDVGGDEQGARALGQYAPHLIQRGYEMDFVVNPYRPFTGDVEGIRRAVAEIETSSRLKATALVSNPNLIGETTTELVERGHRVVEAAAEALGLPLAFIAIEKGLAERFDDNHFAQPVLPLARHFRPLWEWNP